MSQMQKRFRVLHADMPFLTVRENSNTTEQTANTKTAGTIAEKLETCCCFQTADWSMPGSGCFQAADWSMPGSGWRRIG